MLSICFVETKSDGDQHEHTVSLTLKEFEELCKVQIAKLQRIINNVMSKEANIQLVVLAGGGSRLQWVQKYFSNTGICKLSDKIILRGHGLLVIFTKSRIMIGIESRNPISIPISIRDFIKSGSWSEKVGKIPTYPTGIPIFIPSSPSENGEEIIPNKVPGKWNFRNKNISQILSIFIKKLQFITRDFLN